MSPGHLEIQIIKVHLQKVTATTKQCFILLHLAIDEIVEFKLTEKEKAAAAHMSASAGCVGTPGESHERKMHIARAGEGHGRGAPASAGAPRARQPVPRRPCRAGGGVRARAAEGATDSVAAAGAVKAQRRHAGAWEGGAGAGGRGSVSGGGGTGAAGVGGGLRETLVGAARAPRGEARGKCVADGLGKTVNCIDAPLWAVTRCGGARDVLNFAWC